MRRRKKWAKRTTFKRTFLSHSCMISDSNRTLWTTPTSNRTQIRHQSHHWSQKHWATVRTFPTASVASQVHNFCSTQTVVKECSKSGSSKVMVLARTLSFLSFGKERCSKTKRSNQILWRYSSKSIGESLCFLRIPNSSSSTLQA